MRKKILLKDRIFPTITTISKNWREKIKEVGKLGLEEVCFFPTCLKEKERKITYRLLKKINIKRIPVVHLREDMKAEELDYLIENYQTRAFVRHSQLEYPLIYNYSKYRNIIYIENVFHLFKEKELEHFGGICLDFAHLENDRLSNKRRFGSILKTIEKYPIGVNHISAIKKVAHQDVFKKIPRYDSHRFENLSEFDYLKKYPKNYFSNLIAIELENSIKDQLLAKDYIANILEV